MSALRSCGTHSPGRSSWAKKGAAPLLPYQGDRAVSWQQEVFGPMAERTMENAQVYHLAHSYDLGRDSRLAQAIVQEVNRELDREESRRGVVRVRPGELY